MPGCANKKACVHEPAPQTLACQSSKLFAAPASPKNLMTVTAMAYTAQSTGKGKGIAPRAANGQFLTPDLQAIAISPDLFEQGLRFDQKVRILGLEGEFTVMDTMGARHTNTIDIYFGHDQAAARRWGSKTLQISWD